MENYLNNEYNLFELNVNNLGIEKCEPLHSYGPALRDHYLFHYIIDGEGDFYINENKYHLKKGQGFLICPNVVTFYAADGKNPWHYIWVGFRGIKAEKLLKYTNLSIDNPIFNYNIKKDRDYIEYYLKQMLQCDTLKYTKEIRLEGLLYLFLSEIIENSEFGNNHEDEKNDNYMYIKKAVVYIENNYSRDIKVSDIASYIGLNRSYLSTIFKDKLKKSPKEFLINYRIEKACELMNRPNLSISEIARSVGYIDPLNFSKIFKKIKGSSPKKYRECINLGADILK